MTAINMPSRQAAGTRSRRKAPVQDVHAAALPDILNPVADKPLVPCLLLAAVITPLFFALGPIALNPHRALLLITIIPFLMRLFSGKAGPVRLTDGLFIAHVMWSALVIAFFHGSAVIQFTGSNAVEFLGGYLVARVGVRSLGQFMAVSRFYGLLVLISFPFALIETQTGQAPLLQFYGSLPGSYSLHNAFADPRFGLERVQFAFDNAIHYGLFAVLAFSLVTVTHNRIWPFYKRFLIGAIIGICAFLSLSSGAFLALLFQIGFICWLIMMKQSSRPWLILFLMVAVVFIAVEIGSDRSAIMVFLSYATFSPTTAYWRTIIFDYGMQNVYANPIMGLGLNDWVRPVWMYSGSLDNFWLLMAVRYGVPGFAMLAIGWFVPVIGIARKTLNQDSDIAMARRAWMLMIVSLSFALCTVSIWGAAYTLVFFCFGMGMWILDVPEEDATHPGRPGASLRTDDLGSNAPEMSQTPAATPDNPRYTRRKKRPTYNRKSL